MDPLSQDHPAFLLGRIKKKRIMQHTVLWGMAASLGIHGAAILGILLWMQSCYIPFGGAEGSKGVVFCLLAGNLPGGRAEVLSARQQNTTHLSEQSPDSGDSHNLLTEPASVTEGMPEQNYSEKISDNSIDSTAFHKDADDASSVAMTAPRIRPQVARDKKAKKREEKASAAFKNKKSSSQSELSKQQRFLHTARHDGESGKSRSLPSSVLSASEGPGGETGSDTGTTVRFGERVGPAFRVFVPPAYPASARRRGIAGRVVIDLALDAQGKLISAQVLSSPDDSLSQAALKAVRSAVFYPYRPGVEARACRTRVSIHFTLKQGT